MMSMEYSHAVSTLGQAPLGMRLPLQSSSIVVVDNTPDIGWLQRKLEDFHHSPNQLLSEIERKE